MRHGSAILWIILSLAALAAVGAIAVSNQSFYQEFLRASAPTPIPKRPQEAWIEIDFGNGKKRVFLGRVGNERYALSSALEAASREGGFTFRVREDVVDTIGGVRGKWEVSRNGTPVEELLSELTIRGGERYTFRFAP